MSEREVTKQEFLRQLMMLKDAPELYALMSMYTKMPQVFCDPETYDDEVLLFFSEEDARREAEKLMKEHYAVQIVKIEKEHRLNFYTSLYPIGVNCLLAGRGTEQEFSVQLSDLVKRTSNQELEEGKERIENPQMHLTALYLMQELRRNPSAGMTDEMKEWNEEMMAAFQKGRFLVAVDQEKGLGAVKNKEGKLFLPVFTDIEEFHKFNREGKFRPFAVDSIKIPEMLTDEMNGTAVNPLGVNVVLNITKKRVQDSEA